MFSGTEPEGGTAMISRLVRIELESYLHDLVVRGGTVFFFLVLFFSFMVAVVARSGDSLSGHLSRAFLLSVALSSMVVAVQVSRRSAIEKRTRLYAQLPVSPRELSVASWCVRLLCLWIPVLASAVFLARANNMPFARFALITLALYLGGTTLLAVVSVAMNIRHLSPRMSEWANGVYVACAIAAVAIWFIANTVVLPPAHAAAGLVGLSLSGLTGLFLLSAVGLVVIDVWLRERADDYLR
jgi:hypothetical protein